MADAPTPETPLGIEYSDDALESGRLLFARPCTFVKSVVAIKDLPTDGPVEVAFAGRSNVGKSSLLNALVGQNALARTSNTPGRTQALNYFELGGGGLWLVDMPGYGYAKAPKHLVDGWNQLIHDYLRGRQSLRRLCVLIDSRHGLKASDEALMEGLDTAAVSYQVVLTKRDKISAGALKTLTETITAVLKKHPAANPTIVATSSKKGLGMAELRAELASLAAPLD